MNRRSFVKTSGIAAASAALFPTIVPASALGKNGFVNPSDRINVGFIGAGNQAENDANGFLQDNRLQITSICDVNRRSTGYWDGKVGGREYLMELVDKFYGAQHGKRYRSAKGYLDFRELISRKDIDAVVVETPDHWHAIPVLMAARAGKDIYCQKPLSLTISEGRAMADAARKYGVVFQTGSQQRSGAEFRRVCELVRNGRLGKVHTVICGLLNGTRDFAKTGHLTEAAPVPPDFDYDTWLGPAPDSPYCPARTHVNFRWNLDYSGGMVTDWGAHHLDIAQWGLGMDGTGPVSIKNPKVTWAKHAIWNTAEEFYFECFYENGVKLIVSSAAEAGVTFLGTEGKAWVSRGSHRLEPESLGDTQIGNDGVRLYESDNHYRNFIDCVISRSETAAPAEVGHRSITIAHLGNIAMMLGQELEWDPKKERFIDNFAADQLRYRQMREPWGSIYNSHLV